MKKLFEQAGKLIDQATRILLSTHEAPDADGLGSLLALARVLSKKGKSVISFAHLPLPNSLGSFLGQEVLSDKLDAIGFDLVIGLDYGNLARLEFYQSFPDAAAANWLTFDHHLISDQKGLGLIDPKVSSTAELVYQFLIFNQWPIDQETANYLLAGIVDDTGGFRHASVGAQTLKVAGDLMLKGASWYKFACEKKLHFWDKKAVALSEAFLRVRTDLVKGLASVFIDHADFKRFGQGLEEAGVASFLSAAPEIKVALVLIEKEPGVFEGSLRSQKDRQVNVALIAKALGGGGHWLAAGFRSRLSLEEIISAIKKELAAIA
ncbi:MAG: DHH family phosphoesterase [Patescibacteria group bacterium]